MIESCLPSMITDYDEASNKSEDMWDIAVKNLATIRSRESTRSYLMDHERAFRG